MTREIKKPTESCSEQEDGLIPQPGKDAVLTNDREEPFRPKALTLSTMGDTGKPLNAQAVLGI
jgi:hypothetical protein